MHHTAAALAQGGAQRKASCLRPASCQQQPSLRNRIKLQMPAANCAYQCIIEHCHPRARLTRHRANNCVHLHQCSWLMRQPPKKKRQIVTRTIENHL